MVCNYFDNMYKFGVSLKTLEKSMYVLAEYNGYGHLDQESISIVLCPVITNRLKHIKLMFELF